MIGAAIRALNSQITAAQGKGSGVPKEWPRRIAQLKDFRENTPCGSAGVQVLLPPVFARYVAHVFVKDDRNPVEPNTKLQGNMHRRVMMGLTKLHKKDAISVTKYVAWTAKVSARSVRWCSATTSLLTTTYDATGRWPSCVGVLPCRSRL